MKAIFAGLVLSSLSSYALAISPQPPKPESDNLQIFDACLNQWVDSQLPYQESPFYADHQVSDFAYRFNQAFKIGDEKFKLYDVDMYNLERHVKVGGENVPKSLRGLWWMDGNPVPEVVMTLANAVYDKEERTIRSRYNGQDSYLFSPSLPGLATWDIFYILKGYLQMRIPETVDMENLSYGDRIFVDLGVRFGLYKTENLPTTYINDSHWKRETGGHCYNLRQIVDENGNKLPVYDYFIKKTKEQTNELGGYNTNVLIQPKAVD